jgi:hypothetical protein
MREISPAVNMSVEEFLQSRPAFTRTLADKIRDAKQRGDRQVPSVSLIDISTLLTSPVRTKLIDKVALLVDENLVGRSEMCVQFAILLDRALKYLGLPSRSVVGIAIYFNAGKEIFRWPHAWVRIGDEVVDGNVDSLWENPAVLTSVSIRPFWGPIASIPSDRRLRENRNQTLPHDSDVDQYWWPDLKTFIDSDLSLDHSAL